MRFDIETRRESELKSIPCCLSEFLSLAVSPDGLQLAMQVGGGIVEVMPAAGGQSREVFRPVNLARTPARLVMRWPALAINATCCWSATTRVSWKAVQSPRPAQEVGIPMEDIKKISRCILTDGSSFSMLQPELNDEIWRGNPRLVDREAAVAGITTARGLDPGQKGGCSMTIRSIFSIFAIVAAGASLVIAQNTAATMIEAARKTAVVDGDLDGAIKHVPGDCRDVRED